MKSSRLFLVFAILVLSLGMAFTTLAGAKSAGLATISNTAVKTAANAIKDIKSTSDTGSAEGDGSKSGFLEAAAATYTVCVEGSPTCDYDSIQAAVDASFEGDLIKLAAGIYSGVSVRPRDDYTTTGTVTQVVYLDKSITIQGGYTTTNWTTPDSEANPTTLDALGEGRVIYITGEISPTIAGLRITGGDATGMGGWPNPWMVEDGDAGGGIYVISATATILNNQIYSNTAEQAGGVHFLNYDGTFQGNAVTHNIGWSSGLCYSCDGANLSNNDFSSNDGNGLGLIFDGSTIHGNTFSDNDGHGLNLFMNFSTISANTIISNTQYEGAGVYMNLSPATFVNNVIAGNHADGSGSGVYIIGSDWSTSKWLHNTIANNTGGDGSGVYVTSYSPEPPVSIFLTNTVIASQTVGISVNSGSKVTLNGVLWHNTPITISHSATSTISVQNQVTGDPDFVDPGTGDFHITASSAARDSGVRSGLLNDMDEQARPMGWSYDLGADEYPGASLSLLMGTLAEYANAGDALTYTIEIASNGEEDATGVVLTDTLDTYLRATSVLSSLGGCTITDSGWGGELVCTPGAMPIGTVVAVTLTVEVSTTVPPGQDVINNAVVMANETTNSAQTSLMAQDCHVRINEGLTEYDTVQGAVDLAYPGDLIKVAGTCIGVNHHAGRPQQVYLDKDITIRGGYTTTNWTTPDPDANPTTLDALGLGRVVKITPDISVTLEGLRITGGDTAPVFAIGGDTDVDDFGGGISVLSATLTLQANQIEHNRAFGGGALSAENGDITLEDNTITNNTADFCGGVYLGSIRGTLKHNNISSNTSTQYSGGGGAVYSSQVAFEGNVIAWNNAGTSGGGLILYGGSDITMTNNVVADNHAGGVGGGVRIGSSPGSSINMAHNTIARNTAGDSSGIYLYPGSTVALTNTILVSHTVGISLTGNSTVTINGVLWHNTPITISKDVTSTVFVQDQFTGDPAFEEDGYHLTPFSAAIDRGVDSGVAVDIDGDTRPQGASYDLGADETGPVSDLSISVSDDPDPAVVSQSLTYTLVVTNHGPAEATEVELTDFLPQGVTFAQASAGCTHLGSTVSCELGSLPTGAVVTTTIVVTPTNVGQLINYAEVGGVEIDPDSGDAGEVTYTAVAAEPLQDPIVTGVTPESGYNDELTAVTIEGTNLQDGAVVSLNGTHLQDITFVDSHHLDATVPNSLAPSTYDLTVTNPFTRSGVLLRAFTVLIPTPPIITDLTPVQGPNDTPITVHIYGGNFATEVTATLSTNGAQTPLETLTFIESSHLKATVPISITPGIYTLTVTNPDDRYDILPDAYQVIAAAEYDDLYAEQIDFWLEPLSVHQGELVNIGLTLRREGGQADLADVLVRFSVGDETEVYTGTAGILQPNSDTPVTVEWRPDAQGEITLYALIDPQDLVSEINEDNNIISRTVTVLPPLPDITPPEITSFAINDGALYTYYDSVRLDTEASDNPGGSGVASLLFAEYEWDLGVGDWVAVYQSGWLPYEGFRHYMWRFYGTRGGWSSGVRYMQVWASDAAGNISQSSGAQLINFTPLGYSWLRQGDVDIYRHPLAAGERLRVYLRLYSGIYGYVNFYIWGPDGARLAFRVTNTDYQMLDITAGMDGVYQFEVEYARGYSTISYIFQTYPLASTTSQADQVFYTSDEGRMIPIVAPGDSPGEHVGIPSAPIIEPVQADFTASPRDGAAPLKVDFTNLSAGDYATCAWDFGDSGTSENCYHPIYTYTTPGMYTVTLTVSGDGGFDAELKTDYIQVRSPDHNIYLPLILKGDPGLAYQELKVIQKGSSGVFAKPDRMVRSGMMMILLLTGGVGAGWRLRRR